MVACPVCETPIVPGALECATCGHIFHLAAVDASIVPLPDLEPTSAKDLDVPVETTPDLEPTALDSSGPAPTPEPMLDLEATATAPVQVGLDATPDIERTRVVDEDLPSSLPAVLRCRYCGTEGQAQGLFCDTCGMRLPRVDEAEAQIVGEAVAPEGAKCRACGWRVFTNGRCTECGTPQPSAE